MFRRLTSLLPAGGRCLRPASRSLYTSVKQHDDVVTLSLDFSPVNVLKYEFLQHLMEVLGQLDGRCRGLILTSSLKVFSAGADIEEFFKLNKHDDYMNLLSDVCLKFYSMSMPTIACINGHAYAGGAVIANHCDYRFIKRSAKIGLNELAVGITVPMFAFRRLSDLLGDKMGERVVLEGKVYSAEDALKIGWVDAIAENDEQLVRLCENKMKDLTKFSAAAFANAKEQMHKKYLDEAKGQRGIDSINNFNDFLRREDTKQTVNKYLENVRQKK